MTPVWLRGIGRVTVPLSAAQCTELVAALGIKGFYAVVRRLVAAVDAARV